MTPNTERLSDEQIEAVARAHFCQGMDEKEGDWGPNTLNQHWLKEIGIPFARAILAASTAPLTRGMDDMRAQAREVAQMFRMFSKSSHRWTDGRPVHEVAAELLEAFAGIEADGDGGKGLTDERIAEIAESVQAPTWGDFQLKFARAIERELRALSPTSPPNGKTEGDADGVPGTFNEQEKTR